MKKIFILFWGFIFSFLFWENAMGNQSYLNGLNPYNEKLPIFEDSILKKLSLKMGIPVSYLDYSESSLFFIDDLLESEANDSVFINNFLIDIIFYVGKVYINTNGGRIAMILSEYDNLTWEPIIIREDNSIHIFGIHVYNGIFEDEIPNVTISYSVLSRIKTNYPLSEFEKKHMIKY